MGRGADRCTGVRGVQRDLWKHLLEKGTPSGTPNRIALPIAGEDGPGRELVHDIVEQLGFEPIDAGLISDSWRQQPGTPVYGKDFNAEIPASDKPRSTSASRPEQIAVELRTTLDTIRYRREHADDFWSPRELGITAHAEAVRIHPFTDGNGRTTRLLADLVFAAAQDPSEWQYDWNIDKQRYVALLRAFDGQRNARDLAAFSWSSVNRLLTRQRQRNQASCSLI